MATVGQARTLRRCTLGWVVGAAFVAAALIGNACSGSESSAASTAVPMGGGAFGFWVSDAASVKDAVKQVDAKTGIQTHVPDVVPPGFALKSVSEARTAPTDPNKREVLDYYSASFTPTASGAVSPDEPHIQVVELPVVATEGRPTTPIDLGLPGYSAIAVNLTAAEGRKWARAASTSSRVRAGRGTSRSSPRRPRPRRTSTRS